MPPNLCSPKTVRSLLAQCGVVPSRGRGQNFLIDRNTVERLLRLAELTPDDVVLDLGTGLGVMAGAMAPHVAEVVAVEIDSRLLAAAQEVHAPLSNIRWVCGDLRKLTIGELVPADCARPVKVVSNLPYSLSKLVLRELLSSAHLLDRLVLTLQREVADRVVATPGSKDYGPLAIACSLAAEAAARGIVSPNCFVPRPKVDSAIVELVPEAKRQLPKDEADRLFRLVRAAFSQRRKTLVNSLSASGEFGPAARVEAALDRLGLERKIRAESVGPEDLTRLCGILSP